MPEKSLEEINRKARDLFLRGRDAAQQKNYGYAIGLFVNVLSQEPDFLEARRMLRLAQVSRFKQSGNASVKKILVALKTLPSLIIGTTQAGKKPEKAIAVADAVLSEDPTNSMALDLLANAAANAKQTETALLAMEWQVEVAPKNTKLLHKLAKAYLEANKPDKARDTYDVLLGINKNDGVAGSGMRNATAALSMKEGKWDSAQSYREILKDKGKSEILEQENRIVHGVEMIDTLIRENETKLAQDPKNVSVVRTLGGLYANKREFQRAIEYYEQALELSGGADPSLETKITEVASKHFDASIEPLQAQLAANPDDTDIAEQLATYQKQKQQFLLERAEQLVARYPTETGYHFDLGILYYNDGRHDDAIRELQLAQRNPQRRIATLNYLGLCYVAKGLTDLGRDAFLKADSEHKASDGLKKEIIYNLAIAHEKVGDIDKAYEQFKRIYEMDIGFRDVAKRIEKGQGRQ